MATLLVPPPGWIDPHDWTASLTLPNFIVATPSGDRSGNTDPAVVNNLLANEQYVMLGPGTWFQNIPYQITNSSQMFVGSGYHVTTCTFIGSNPATAQLIVGPTSVIQNVTVRDMQFFGNSSAGHNILWRAAKSTIQNMILQNAQNDCLHVDPNTVGGSIDSLVCFNISGIHPGSNGYFQDSKVNDSDFYSMTFDGGTSGDTVVGGNIGINLTGGSNNRFFGCHPFLFANGGVSNTGLMNCFYGGECESNGTADMIFTNAHHTIVHGVAFYDHANAVPPTQHILFTGTTSGQIDIGQCDYRADTFAVANFAVNSNSSTNISIHDCPGFNPTGVQTPPTYTAGSATTNPFMFACRVFVTGATAVALNGTATGLAAPCTVDVGKGETITPTGAGAWTWFGL